MVAVGRDNENGTSAAGSGRKVESECGRAAACGEACFGPGRALGLSDIGPGTGGSRTLAAGTVQVVDVSNDVKLQGASRERLAAVERIAKQWRERSTAPLGSVAHEPLADGHTVLAMMVAEHIDEAAVVGALDELLAKLQGKPKSRSQKLADAGFKRRPSSRSLPSDD